MIAPASDLSNETLDRDASMPLYLQLASLLRGRIERSLADNLLADFAAEAAAPS